MLLSKFELDHFLNLCIEDLLTFYRAFQRSHDQLLLLLC
ncbi:hypothetical protein GGE56_007508 [Rhizobium leguminosarum]|uniref:Uncharacterized protein n=1 Tax=Rhizobium leguminosarum TaxID=384 RepID=A0A2Z4YJD9_RHILE|nr:hypothetical protein DLJ82_3800 [Rhizobium leguminosarum]MBB4332948.1 hypothetical protein [Rhizobium leguminosarum]MBB4343582.1 hypothetical protein [Rhizobium leguminosarum]MBB4358544.1 hypothetical protein [Rhizobium leguminosarum]MBB4470620.1 hypothetical protein [Rhizobium leguminosarum]